MWVSQRSETEHACIVERGPAKEDGHTHLSLTGLAQSRIPEQSAPPTRLTRERANDLVSRSLQRAHHPTLEQLCTDLIVEVCYSVGAVAMGGRGGESPAQSPYGRYLCVHAGKCKRTPCQHGPEFNILMATRICEGPFRL